MKFFITLSLVLSFSSFAQECFPPKFLSWSTGSQTNICTTQMLSSDLDPENCIPQIFPQLQTFQNIIEQGKRPWWVEKGNAHFPNVAYPGVWKNDQIDASYYPGSGEVFAAKPNVYIQSIHEEKKMKFQFLGDEAKSFLATTPMLTERLSWEGKIIETDKFEIEGVIYDYLFYDIRLPKSAMQFNHGVCTTRAESIEWMIKDLGAMNFPAISLSDFEDHWRVKIPDYPYFCIYPQYNEQLDPVLPVQLGIEQASFTRALYVLVAYRDAPDSSQMPLIPFPNLDPESIRPSTLITRENMFKEWGVAFLGE
ncbi:MAG TPA: hypothetical protein VKZ84_03545 [Bacteriovoracaceae bacterium]|nr:hypothetical protein [Bacteriovoracaceae bacterium]